MNRIPDDTDALLRRVNALLEERRQHRDMEAAPDDARVPQCGESFDSDDGPDHGAGFSCDEFPDYEESPEDIELQRVRQFHGQYGLTSHIPAYNQDYEAALRRGTTGALSPQGDPDAYEEEEPTEEAYMEKRKNRGRRRGGCLWRLLVAALLVGCVLLCLWMKKPTTDDPLGARKPGAATILLCGTDVEGYRTDTMMLLYINNRERTMSLVSLPRDTMTRTTAGGLAKLNSAFGRNNGLEDPEEGMDNLLLYVKDIIGYVPDGYVLLSLRGFQDLVDAFGGVEFDVPRDMYYNDPSQGLFIDLKKGLQHLSGQEAMGLVRFRKGYVNQDLGRVSVQREFLTACMKQWLRPGKLVSLPEALKALKLHAQTNLTGGNFAWLAVNALLAGPGRAGTVTLPGEPAMVKGSSYYVLDPEQTAQTVNEFCNPYQVTITPDMLKLAGQ